MSFLNWESALHYTSYRPEDQHNVKEHWELWDIPRGGRHWYHFPKATIYKVSRAKYELDLDPEIGATPKQIFSSLKAAKAMGILLIRME